MEDFIGYYVQIGKGKKGRYKTKYHFALNQKGESQAHLFYHGTNCGLGFKKRLLKVDFHGINTVIRKFESV